MLILIPFFVLTYLLNPLSRKCVNGLHDKLDSSFEHFCVYKEMEARKKRRIAKQKKMACFFFKKKKKRKKFVEKKMENLSSKENKWRFMCDSSLWNRNIGWWIVGSLGLLLEIYVIYDWENEMIREGVWFVRRGLRKIFNWWLSCMNSFIFLDLYTSIFLSFILPLP